ncbi:MAG: trypsin-like peptidase domain-containing protein [Bacteroidota bacterium]
MSGQILRGVIILLVPLMVGMGLGYSIRPASSVEPGTEIDAEFDSAFPDAEPVRSEVDRQDDAASSRQNAITRAVARVSPAVVGINVIEMREYRDPVSRLFGDDPWMRRFFGDRSYRQQVKGLGSGFIISPDGYIVTNDHVAGSATQITVTLTSGAKLEAKLIGSDPVSDIALLKVDGKDLPYLNLGNSDDVVTGEWAIAFGNPFGLFEINDKPTVTVGVVSSSGMNLGRVENRFYRDMIETDAAINGGNSGGPLVNSLGDVIGMNTLIFTGGQGTTFVGYGFAIPINKIKRIVAELKRSGKVARDSWHGFDFQSVDARIARYFGLDRAEGAIVSEIENGGPGEKAGLKVGDIIVEANGQKIVSEDDLYVLLSDSRSGETITMKVIRDKKSTTISMKLERRST